MVRMVLWLAIALVLTVCGAGTEVSGASACTVKYYYTSSQNPEGVPAPTAGMRSGSKWIVKPAGPSRSVYTKSKNGKTRTCTFDGWYTNINCMGTRYAPGQETTALAPASSSGGYTINLYGRWLFSDQNAAIAVGNKARSVSGKHIETNTKSTAPAAAKSAAQAAAKKTAPSAAKKTAPAAAKNAAPAAPKGATSSAQNVQKQSAKAPVTVNVFRNRSREEALATWRHLLIDTFFHINGRKYSYGDPGKYWTDSRGAWSGKTGKKGNTQSCVTLSTVSLKRTGIISPESGCIWLSSNKGSAPNGTVKRLKETSPMLSISYPHKSLKRLAASGAIRYGDILCRSGHTFIYMGKDADGRPLIYESGTHRDIGNGTRVSWGHHSGGYANKLTGKINKQIRKSNAVGAKWRKKQISDAAFKGHRASGKNLNKPVHIVCSINTFSVRTNCTNGTISPGDNYMAGEDVSVRYAPAEGKTLDYVQVDGRKVSASGYGTEYTFRRISSNHTINVVYK